MPSMFQEVLAGRRPGEIVFEDDRTFAFLDAEPTVVGHALVTSKLVVDRVHDLPILDYLAMWTVVRTLAPALQTVTKARRVVVLVTGFGVPHAHVHLMPADTRDQALGGARVLTSPDELASLAAKVRAEMATAKPDTQEPTSASGAPAAGFVTPS